MLFIRVIENKRPGPALGWAAGHRVNSFLHAQKGSGGREAKRSCRREADLSSTTPRFTSAYSSPKTRTVISTLQTSTQDLLDFSPSFNASLVARGNPAISLQLLLCQTSSGTNRPQIPVPALKHDRRVTVTLPTQPGCLSEEDAPNMWRDRASTHTGTHVRVLPRRVSSV